MQRIRENLKRLMPSNLDWFGTAIGRIGLGLLMFLIGLFAFFPEAALKERLQVELATRFPGSVNLGSISLGLPFSVKCEEITIRMADHNLPELSFDTLTLTPHLATLIGQPGVDFTARSGDGHISGSISRAGTLELVIEQYLLDLPIQGFSGLRLTGRIEDADVLAQLQPVPDKPSRIELLATGLSLTGTGSFGLSADRLNLGQLSIIIEGEGQTLNLTRGKMSGGDILVEASGSIITGRSVQSTRLNLNLNISPAAGLDPAVASLFELLGTAGNNGARNLSVRGTLARPSVR